MIKIQETDNSSLNAIVVKTSPTWKPIEWWVKERDKDGNPLIYTTQENIDKFCNQDSDCLWCSFRKENPGSYSVGLSVKNLDKDWAKKYLKRNVSDINTDVETYLSDMAAEDFENQTAAFDYDDFDSFVEMGRKDGYELTRDDFDYYFECLDALEQDEMYAHY